MDNDQMRAMYNSFGTLNRPQSYGDDLYNDRENIIPAQPMTQTGEDEAGNPIMAPVEMPETENKPILNNVIDVVSDVVATPGAFSGQVGPLGAMTDTVANYIMGNDEQRQQILDRMQRYTPQGIESGIKNVIHSMSNATELEHTKLYENYFYNAEKKNAEIKRIANLLQIDENAFAHDRELYQKAALAADRVERMGKFKKYQDAEGNIDMAKIYADVPGLAEVQQKQGTAAAALALGNIDGIQSINEVYDNAFSRFAGSVYAGARRGYIADRRSAIWNAARKENRLPTTEEQAKLDEYDAELRTLPKYNYNTVGNVAGAMIGGAAENLTMIVKSQGAGAVAGVVAGRVGGAKAGEIARNAVSTYMMAQDIAGSQYEELVNKVDANGRPMYTPEQASWLALSQGVGEAVLEQYSLNQMGKAIFGRSAAKSITEIIRNSPTIEAAKAGVRDYAALKLSEAGKAGLISLGSEAFEEFTQQASDMLMENMAQVMLKGKDADITSVEDILAASTGQMVEALPAIGGFGLIGFGANPIANTRAVLGFRSNVRNVVNNKVLIGRMANAHYGEVLDGVWKNKGNIKELQDKAPESVTTILDTQNRLAGMEDGFVDVRELSKENADLVDQIAEANNISKDELAACLDGSGMLQVKTSTLMQMDLKDEQHKAIRDNVTTSLDAFTLAQENNAIKLVKEQMDSLQAFNDKTYKQAVENIIQARFPDAEQARLAREIIEANYDNPQEEFKRRLDAVNAEMDEYIAPVLAELRSGMKQGVDIIRMEGDRDAKYVKQSNNADWYRNYYADYGRAPNAEELRNLAIDIASGRQNNRYGLMDYQNNTDESREYFGNVAQTLDKLEEQRNALMSIQDRMRDLNPGEMVATASLSKEGLKVYDTMRQMMGESENKDVRKAGAFNALFLARYADNMAKAISKARNIPYTAEDFVRDRFRIDVNAEYNEDLMAAQLYQESPDGSVAVAPGVVELNAASARDKDTQNYLRDVMAQKGLTEEEQQGVLDWIEQYVSLAEGLLDKHPSMREWHEKGFKRFTLQNGVQLPAISAFKNNGEYEYNIDLGSLCTKREALDFIIQLLVDNGLSQKIGPTQYTALSDMLAEMGFLTHCKICFVEGKRVRVLMDANKFSFEWRSVLRALGIEDDNVVGDEREFTPEQMARLETMTDVTPVPVIDPKTGQQKMKKVKDKKTGEEKLVPETEKAFKLAYRKFMPMYARRQTGDAGITPDKMFMIAKLFKENPSLAGIFKPEWLQTSKGTSWLIDKFGTTTSIKSVLASMYGAATSKPLEYFSVYDPISWGNMFDRKNGAEGLVKHLYDIGGVRAQSFTDFNPMLFVDYVQMVADLAVRALPMHVYTKVPSFVKLFGETGMMINMSLVARVDPNTDAEHAGLVWNPETKEWDYAWADESFPVEEAFALRENPKYGGRVGTIAVALSDEHMKKLLADPRIDQVIPFHKSGMSEEVLAMTGLNRAKDFTNEQTEKNVPKGMGVISYNTLLQKHKDPRIAADKYLEWCDKNHVTPTFPKYRDNPNYYKLQEDFRGYDNDNKPVIQKAVRMQLPENAQEILDEAWTERGAYMEKLAGLKNNPQFLEKAMKRLEPQHIDGEVRKELMRRLRNIMGSKNVVSLQQGDFLDALENHEAQTMGRAAAKSRVEVFRNGQGIVYGFTHNGKIYLNENTFNANTPAHEFTHVWVQVARKENPKLWNHGKSMLKDTYEWVQVTHDPLYANIRGDEDAIASEVLSRIVGRENEAFVRDFMDKGQLEKQIRMEYKDDPKERDRLLKFVKYGTGKTLRKQIMDWFKELWGSVRSLFDPVKNGEYPTYDEFIRMPLKDLWDNTAEGNKTSTTDYSKRFAKALKEIYKDGGIEDMPASEYGNRGGGMEQVAASATEMQGELLQQQGRTAKGSLALTEQGQKIISLFESADQSTFVHEMAHMFLLDLQEIAGIDRESQQAKDLDTIMKWAEYKPGQADEYKGTASAEEFRKRDAAIKEAEAKGDEAEARRLKDVWAQERFARAFEEYLKSGEAPAQGLKRAFRAFKKWLVQIYNDVLGAGVRATPEVEAVMARMVASEEEIDAMEAANAIARIRKVDADILSTDAQEMIQRWQTEAKEQAKEKMLKELMKEYEQNNLKDIDKRLEQFKETAREELQNVPCFVCEQLIKDGTDMASALEITGFANQDEYTVALIQNGGSLENALNKMTEQAKANMLTEMPSRDKLYSMAEEALLSGDYNTRLAELEAQLLKRRQARYDNIPARLRNAFSEMDEAIKEFEAAKVKEAVKKLKYAERWDAKNFETIKELESYLAKMERQEEDRAKLIEKFNKKYNELKEKTVRNTRWLQGVRDATLGHARVLQAAAVFRLAEESVSVATNARYWHRQALKEAKRAWDNISGAQRTGREANFNAAVDAKQQQAVLDAMTAQAIKNKKQVDKWLNGARDGFKARAKRMADPKVKANVDMRYFHNHLLYVFGLRNSDAIPPTNYKSFQDLLAELRASHQFEDEVPAWLVSAAEASDQGKNYQQLTMGELEKLYKLTRILYRLGLNDKGLLTMDVDMDTVVAECTADWMQNTDYEVGNQRINEVKGAIGSYMNGLLKPEVLLSLLGGEQGGFVKYIYRVLFNAAEAEEKAREKEAKVQRELYSKYYTKEELRAMVNDPVYINVVEQTEAGSRTVTTKQKLTIGEDTDITKENLICMALNWGNEANKARLLVGLFDCKNETQLAQREMELKEILQAQLTKKDWEFVQAMWDHIGEFADPVSEVMEKSVGVPLDRVKAQAFDVEVDGEVIRLPGGYYPIVKDSSKSVRQTEFEQMEEAKAVGGVSVFGTGMSATKERAKNMFLNQGPLKLTLDVANNHITAQIHLINAKMAVRDAYKVINNKQIQDMVRRTCGEETVKTMNDWVLNCWAPPIRPRSWYENMAASLRSKTVGAIMGYRVSTALLNAANVVYMAQEIGTKNTLAAIVDFYRHPIQNREMILDISVYMRNRATNMDRDLQAQNEQILKRHTKVGNAIDKATGGKSEDLRYQMDKYANWLIEQTDMMVSMPMYMWQFKQTYSEEIAKGVPEEEARETANYEAVRRMTKVFPSSRAVDSSAIQRTKSEMTKLITPFFSFANTMMNAVWSKYYAGKFKGNERVEMLDDNGQPMLDEDGEPKYTTVKKSFVKRYGRFARAILFNFVLGAMVETLLRQVPDALAGTGDDDEDKFYSDLRKNVLSSAVAGFPGINEGINVLYSSFFEKPSFMGGRGVGVLSGTAQRYTKVVTDIAKITQGKESIDAIDLFRDVARATNTKTGISDTLTDAIFNTARFIGDDYKFDDMADLREYIAKTIFDRKLKKK